MKKLIAILFTGLLAFALFACNDNPPDPTGNTPTTQSSPGAAQDIYFAPKGVHIEMGAAPAPVLDALKDALGEPLKIFPSKSCALNAEDINYKYQGFELTVTYPERGEDYITGVRLLTDDYATPGGVRVKGTFEEVLAAYGTDYEENSGEYTYSQGLSRLKFMIIDGKAEQIIYEYDFLNA